MNLRIVAVVLSLLAGSASAQTASAPTSVQSTPVAVFMSPTVILPEQGSSNSTVNAKPEELMWRAGLGVEEVAALADSVSVEAGGMSRAFNQTTPLWRAEAREGIAGQPLKGRLYCGVRFRKGAPDLSEKADVIFRTSMRATSEPRLCLLDEDSDGVFDHGVAVGRLKSGPAIVSIPAARYEQVKNLPLPDISVQFRPIKGGALQGPQISFDAFIGDRRLIAAAMHMLPRTGTEYRRVYSERSIKSSSYPAVLPYGDMSVTVLAYDSSTRTVTARLDQGFYWSPVYFEPVGPVIIGY